MLRLFCLLVSVVAASYASDASQFVEDEGVLVLCKLDFEEAKKQFKHLLVEFYSPWCGHCKSIAPEYVKAAQMLKEQGSEIKFAKVDATKEIDLRDQYNVTGFPTFKFFLSDKDKVLDFQAGRHASDFVSYVQRKTGPPATIINNVEEAKTFVTLGDFILFGFLKSPAAKEAFEKVIFDTDKYKAAVTDNEQVFEAFDVKEEAVVAFKKFDEERVELKADFTYQNIKQFISNHHLPLVNEFLEENAVKIFSTDVKVYTILFANRGTQQFTQLSSDFKNAAAHFRGKVIFIFVNLDEEDNNKVLEFFGVTVEQCPTVRFVDLSSVDPIKYNPQSAALDEKSVVSFVNDVLDGRMKPYYKTDDVPSNWDAKPVKLLVGKNFHEFVKASSKNVIVDFFAPWCGHCKKLEPIWDQLGEKYQTSDKVVVAKLDSTTNELEDIDIKSFPTIKLFLKGFTEAIEYTGERSFDALVAFIESDGKIIHVPESGKSPEEIATEVKDEL